jgi:cellobiose-specific phosphotransferase system component IIB
MYDHVCLFLIKLSQWAYKNSSAVWLATISTSILTLEKILSEEIFLNWNWIITSIFIFVSIILITSLVIKNEKIRKWLMKKYIKYLFEKSTVAVLDGRINDTDTKPILPKVKFTAQNWKSELEKQGLHVELIPVSSISKKYSMIINPFGSHYVEEDFSNLKTFHRIKDYIHWGGVFINTWNLAFWESWNSREGKKFHTSAGVDFFVVNTSPLTIEEYNRKEKGFFLSPVNTDSSLVDTLLLRQFGIRTTMFENPMAVTLTPSVDYLRDVGEYKLEEFRSAINSIDKDRIFYKLFSSRIDDNNEIYPISALNHYIGYLVLFGTALNSKNELNFECKIIKKIFNRLFTDGRL